MGHSEVVEFLLQFCRPVTPPVYTLLSKQKDKKFSYMPYQCLKHSYYKELDINALDGDDKTPLQLAADKGWFVTSAGFIALIKVTTLLSAHLLLHFTCDPMVHKICVSTLLDVTRLCSAYSLQGFAVNKTFNSISVILFLAAIAQYCWWLIEDTTHYTMKYQTKSNTHLLFTQTFCLNSKKWNMGDLSAH